MSHLFITWLPFSHLAAAAAAAKPGDRPRSSSRVHLSSSSSRSSSSRRHTSSRVQLTPSLQRLIMIISSSAIAFWFLLKVTDISSEKSKGFLRISREISVHAFNADANFLNIDWINSENDVLVEVVVVSVMRKSTIWCYNAKDRAESGC